MGPNYAAPVTYGFVSGMADDFVLTYLLKHRSNSIARRVFFSEIDKRPGLSFKVIDAAAEELLDAIVDRQDRARNEAFLRRLIPRMSQQMRTRTVRTILSSKTKLTRSHVLRWVTLVAMKISSVLIGISMSTQLRRILYTFWDRVCWIRNIVSYLDRLLTSLH